MEQKQGFDAGAWLWLCSLTLAAWILNTLLTPVSEQALLISAIALAAIFVLLCLLLTRTKLRGAFTPRRLALLACFFFGFFLSLKYHYLYSCHDLGTYYADENCVYDGHLGIIYWFAHNFSLPTMNPLSPSNSILAHPPLYHMIAGLFMRVQQKLGIAEKTALENLQLVNLFFAEGFVLLCGEILRTLRVSQKRTAAGMLLCGFTPIVPLMAAVPSNDILSLFLSTLCVLFVLRWIQSPKMSLILLSGVSLGFAMAAKLNAATLIPSVAIVFLLVFFRNRSLRPQLLGQYAAFLPVSVPQAVAWPLYHLLRFQMPLSYVRLPDLRSFADFSPMLRFLIPSAACFSSPYYTWNDDGSGNIWMTCLKTLVFDEETPFGNEVPGKIIAWILLALFALLFLFSLLRFVRISFRRKNLSHLFLLLVFTVSILSFIRFNLSYPYACSANFRYIMLLLPILSYGAVLEDKEQCPELST